VRAQALAITSVNDQWGVFSRSRVQLLPHQLWVCRKVNQQWPFRWLVADDVGLGKTIECGLVLMPLIASGRIRRLLVLAPAKLVPQWQYRLKDMFDIRLQRYAAEADTQRGDFWATASMVVASFHRAAISSPSMRAAFGQESLRSPRGTQGKLCSVYKVSAYGHLLVAATCHEELRGEFGPALPIEMIIEFDPGATRAWGGELF
jgi:hypothetical protein